MSRCLNCGTRKQSVQYLSVSRVGGGAYNRASRRYRTTVCEPCGRELVAGKQEGHQLVGAERFSCTSIEYALSVLKS